MPLSQLSEQVGITVVNLSILKNSRARAIRFSTLARLCAELECQAGDILAYEPELSECTKNSLQAESPTPDA
jgi:putative transcriptional regulator